MAEVKPSHDLLNEVLKRFGMVHKDLRVGTAASSLFAEN